MSGSRVTGNAPNIASCILRMATLPLPAPLYPHLPRFRSCRYVESFGGPASIVSPQESSKTRQRATVCGEIAGEHTATNSLGTPTFINLDTPYPNQVFTVLVWGSDRLNVGSLPRTGRICSTGTITDYRGTPEIVIYSAQDWFVLK